MSETLKRIERFKQDQLQELLTQCTPEQQGLFKRLYPGGPRDDQFAIAIDQCERTVAKNRKRAAETVTAGLEP